MPVERKCVLCNKYVVGRQWLFTAECPSCGGEDSLQTLARYQRFMEIMRQRQTTANSNEEGHKVETNLSTKEKPVKETVKQGAGDRHRSRSRDGQ